MGVMIVLLIPFFSRILIVRSTHLGEANSESPEIGFFFLITLKLPFLTEESGIISVHDGT